MSKIAFKLTTLALATIPLLADAPARAENGQIAAGIAMANDRSRFATSAIVT